jgi:hypothetical protein
MANSSPFEATLLKMYMFYLTFLGVDASGVLLEVTPDELGIK